MSRESTAMNTKLDTKSLLAGVLLGLLVCACLAGFTFGANTGVGRYQIIAAGSTGDPYIYYLDTKTGRCWVANTPVESAAKDGWHPVPMPAGR